ncbi:Ig-like domain-containing protein, partial [Caulobacter hibisci]
MVGQEIFLGGTYLDLALNSSGTLGSRSTAPTGFVTDAVNGYIRLGMVGDTDGFGTGKAATRDAMLAGTPVESFSLGYEIGGTRYVKTNSERAGTVQITGGQTTNLSESGTAAAGWTGTTTEKVKVNQVFSLSDDAKYVKVEITLTNLSSAALDNLRYMRSIDPDHGASFNTNNKILEQGGDSTGGALIAAYASGTSTPLFYYTADERARVSTYGFENKDPYAAAAYDSAKGVGYTLSGDTAINIDFVLGSLKAGASTTITFYMGITNDLAATVKAINAAAAGSANTNHAPELVSDTATVTAGASVSGNVLSNDKDADGDALTASLKAGPSHGTVTLAADGSYKYVAASGYAGSDSFTYTVSDGKTTSSSTVTLTVQ